MYSYFYRILQNIILKRSFYNDVLNLINEDKKIKQIIEIGCADSILLKNINRNYLYDGFDINKSFINKSKKKYKDKYNFLTMDIDEINFSKYDPKNSIIILIGVLHHISDKKINRFINRTKNFKIYAIDAVRIKSQKAFTKFLLDKDAGNFVRYENHYKRILLNFNFFLAKNKYLIFPYDHLISFKHIEKKIVKNLFNDSK